ncbi:MAG: hypothetical protein ABI177_11675 [Edaphobacter sp.]
MQRGLGGKGLIFVGWLAAIAIGMVPCAAFAAQTVAPATQQPATPTATPTRMTKAQAKELFRSVDEILSFVSTDSKLPIEHSVKRKLISREQVNRYLKKKFDNDEGTKRMERSEIVLKKFGLLDRDFHLRPFLLSLLTEQIAGFYDNKTKTISLLDWIPPDQQKPVLAHELTHALQDQKVGLSKWSDVTPQNTATNAQQDNQHIQMDEADTARDAVAEGQAMAVFVDYALRPTGKTLADAPDLGDRMQDMATDSSGSPVMARAPLLLQQSLLFPYTDGLKFEQAILVKKGVQAAFADVLANPPSSSFEIMNPQAYMAHVPVPVLRLPDIHLLIDAEYTPYDVGVMGELDVRMLTELFGGRKIANTLAPQWAGGVYYAAQRKSAVTEAEKSSTASIALLYYSRWKNVDAARSFLRVYASEIPRKYSGVVRRSQDEANGDEQIYSTREGDVLLSISGSGVFVSEGFELPLARKLRDEVVGVQPEGPIQTAAVQPHELSLGLAHTLSSFGIIRATALQRYTFEGHPSTTR